MNMSVSYSLYDEVSRRRKATKIIAILKDHLNQDLSHLRILDLGCGSGIIASCLSHISAQTVGVDRDMTLLRFARSYRPDMSTLHFSAGSAANLPYLSNLFDVVLCAQVYEHVDDQAALAREVWRVLKPGGICLFSGPNRLAVIEEHYWLPFLSWLPRALANLYMRIFRRGCVYDAYPRTYWHIRRLWRRFIVKDYTVKMIRDPERFGVERYVSKRSIVRRLPIQVLQWLTPLFPNYNWILEKPYDAVGK